MRTLHRISAREEFRFQRRVMAAVTQSDSGSALVEFAVSAILLLTLMMGLVECSRAVYVNHFVANAAQEGARYGIVRGSSWSSSCNAPGAGNCMATSSTLKSYVQALAPSGVSASNLNVTVSWPGINAAGASCVSPGTTATNAPGCLVSVQVSYPFTYLSPLLPAKTLNLTSTAQSTIVE